MEPRILYNLGANTVNGRSLFITVFLLIVTVACLYFYERRRRAGTLQPETRFILLTASLLVGGTLILFLVSSVPDMIQPPVIERGRVMKVYLKNGGPDSSPTTWVKLSNGADLLVPDPLIDKLQTGACMEMTRTPATSYILVARQLAPDDCLTS